MMKAFGPALICALLVGAAWPHSASRAAEAPASCAPSGDLSYVCGVSNVEDMVLVPGTAWVIGSSMRTGKKADAGGDPLYLIDTVHKVARVAAIVVGPEPKTGPFAGCPAPDMAHLGTHGLELRAGTGGAHTLYAVNHGAGGRETMEVFKVEAKGAAAPVLTWTGCTRMPANSWMNSIAAMPGGGLMLSEFEDLDKIDMVPVFEGKTTGKTYFWTPAGGFKEFEGGRLSGNNGLLASKDGKTLWINDQGRKQVIRFALDGSAPPVYAKVGFRPDNLRWTPDGKIMAAGQKIEVGGSLGANNPWGVARVDPQTMAVTPVLDEPGRPEFSNGTVALQVGDTLWLGNFRGDRVAYVKLK